MRIGLLTTSFPRFGGDIAGQFVLGFASALAQRGHTIDVLAPEPAAGAPPPDFTGLRLRWVPYLKPRALQRTFYGAGVPENLARDVLAWPGLLAFPVALLRAARRDLASAEALVSHWALPCALIAGAVRGERPHLAVLHSADLHLLSRLPARAALASAIARGATALVFVSELGRDRFLGWLPPAERAATRARCHVQAMGIDEPAPGSDRARTRAELGLSRFTLLSIGRLVPIKGLYEALTSLAHREDLEWLIAGEGPLEAELRGLATRTRLRVRLLGRVAGASKQAALAAADAFVLPSRVLPTGRSEGVPTVLLEAMAYGLPVLASNVGGVPEVVRPCTTGLLFEPTAPDGLERALERIRLDPALRGQLAAGALHLARDHYWSAIAPRLEAWLAGVRPGYI